MENEMADDIRGYWAAIATPIAADGSVDNALLARHAADLLGQGLDGLVLFGTTGEGTSFSAKERLDTVSALLKGGIGPDRLALGTGYPSIADTISLTKDMLALGLRHALVLPPYFYRDATPAGLEDAFTAVFDKVNDSRLRATLYNIPQVSGVAVPPAVLASLSARFGAIIAGVKDSSADFEQFRAYRAAAPKLSITVGDEASIARAIAEGGTGTICGMANIVPALVKTMFDGLDSEPAMRSALALMQGPFISLLKSILAAQTGEAGWSRVRAPLSALPASRGEAIVAALKGLPR
jgi:4-hydroxy-tetrahydrodipicolinate synthase